MKCWEQGDIDEKVTFSILAIKMLAKATAMFIPMAVPWVCRQLLQKKIGTIILLIQSISDTWQVWGLSLCRGYALSWYVGVEAKL